MNKYLLSKEVIEYLRQHESSNPNDFALKKHPFEIVNAKELTQQLVGIQKAKKKLPTWYNTTGILFPPKLNIEQTSSEKTAAYKASLVSGSKMIDITGGFGIDSYFFSKQVESLTHCELNQEIHELAAYNFQVLGSENIISKCTDGVEFMKFSNDWDWVYIDPSRRSYAKGKVFLLEDCLPNVVDLMDTIFDHAQNILIKTAPIYDITEGLRVLKHIKEVHIVALDNEVKELLWLLEKDFEGEVTFVCTSIEKKKTYTYRIPFSEIETSRASFSTAASYLYEPFAVFMKLGGFAWVSSYFKLNKLHSMSHLYTSSERVDFPGKTFEVNEVLPYNKAAIKKFSKESASVVTRNFKIKANELRKKLKLKEDDQRFLFFTTGIDGKQLVIDCQRIN